MRKLITFTLAVLLVGLFTAVVYAAVQAGGDSSTTGTTGTTATTTTPEGGPDISGPRHEAEHATTRAAPGAAPGTVVDDGHRGRGRGRGRGCGGDDHRGNSGPGGGGDD